MFEVGVVAQFEAAHALHGDFGPATRRHGHTYRVEVTVRGETLKEDGTLLDLGALQAAVAEATGELHYQDLDQLTPFSGRNSTAEAVAEHLCRRIARTLPQQGVSRLSVRAWE